MIQSPKPNPRGDYLRQENLRVEASSSLGEQFPALKSVTVELGYFNEEGIVRSSQIKYTLNLNHARSVFRVACQNHECVRGDFDLSDILARAVQEHQNTVSGEIRCEGWKSRTAIGTMVCGNILRYTITLGY